MFFFFVLLKIASFIIQKLLRELFFDDEPFGLSALIGNTLSGLR